MAKKVVTKVTQVKGLTDPDLRRGINYSKDESVEITIGKNVIVITSDHVTVK
jgi:hypothetical protein